MSGVALSKDTKCRSLGFVNNPPRGYFRTVKSCYSRANGGSGGNGGNGEGEGAMSTLESIFGENVGMKGSPSIITLENVGDVFDEIVQKMPEGMNMIKIERKGEVVSFTGVAESAPRISNFMRNLAGSQWITKPDIEDIQDDKDSGAARKLFKLKSKLTSPNAADKEAQ